MTMDVNELIKFNTDMSELIKTIRSLQSTLYSDNKFVWPTGKTNLQKLRKFLEANGVDISSASAIEKALKEIRKSLSELEEVRVKVALNGMSTDFWVQVFAFLKEKVVKEPFVLVREYDKSLLGGVILYLKGSYFDLSLRTKLNDYFKNGKTALTAGVTSLAGEN
ncbi:hypothetical protein GF360_04340 [candidate division WWE3 bacterium]|nr:hypothetical protein [candidate division WWE3 bacterium]